MASGTAQWALSLVAHAAIGTALIVLRPPSKQAPTTFVSMADEKTEKPKPPPPPPAPRQDGAPTTKAAPAPARAPARVKPDAAPAAENATGSGPDLDLGLSNEGGPGGLSVPPGGGGAPSAPSSKPVEKRLQPAAAQNESCDGPTSKPKALSVPQPAYPESARAAGVTGKVRVEVSVDAQGVVTSARILSGLGHGLDEAALRAAQTAKFSPALRCGKPTAATFVIGMRFAT